eukprot:7457611-Ditylum_brightwellii.AAC.1
MDSHDQQLFNKLIGDRLNTTPQSKQHWLAAVQIAVTDFTEVHGRLPTQLRLKNNNPETTAHDTASSWEEEDLLADPAGDFAPLFER